MRWQQEDQRRALDLYYDLLALKEPPMRILSLMSKEYRDLFHVKQLSRQGYGRKDIAFESRPASLCGGEIHGSGKTFSGG